MNRARVLLVVLVAALMAAAHQLGLFGVFAEPARAKVALLELGPLGYLAFVAAYAVLQPFGVPGTVFIMVAPLIWPWPVAFGLSMVGTMAASVVGFAFARFVAREWIARRIPARFKKYDEALERRGFATVFTLRLIFWMPPMLHAFFGVSKVRFWTHFWGSFFGYVPTLFLVSYFGEKLFEMMKTASTGTWVAVVAATIAIVAGAWWLGRRRAAREAS
ncbi:MAG: VTT domain-containing protein, partial [Myxococcales bacterium]|nr:VTT domain-containing protein [Myxococcales bacterium]